jgi:hypothetical protein
MGVVFANFAAAKLIAAIAKRKDSSTTPNQPKGTVRGKKLTKAQQRLFGTARGMQEAGKTSKTAAGQIAKSIVPSDLSKIAKKPKGGYRKKK